MFDKNEREAKVRDTSRKKQRSIRPKTFLIVLTVITTFICLYWITAALYDRDLIDIAGIKTEEFPTLIFLTSQSIVMFIVTLVALWLMLAAIHKHRKWLSIVPLMLFLSTLIAIFFMPTKATKYYHQKSVILDRVVAQAQNTMGVDREFTIDLGEEIDGQWLRYYDRKRELAVLCVEFSVGNNMSLYYSSSTILADCAETPNDAWQWSGYWTWSRKLDNHWYETSDSPLFWFLELDQALKYITPFITPEY